MTTDRELLELAAKAAGIRIKLFNSNGHAVIAQDGGGPESCLVTIWNPLVEDGQALRLAVRLSILLRTDFIKVLSGLMGTGMEHGEATRRAIVDVAAEIARKLHPHRCQYCEDKLCAGTGIFTQYGQNRPCDGIPF